MRPLVSVIIPAYNCEAYIERTVESLRNQTYDNLEMIIVDDGSKDGTAQLCARLEQMDSRIHFFSKENGGAASARNYGMKQASGEYIAFVDADDEVLLSYIEYMYELLQKYTASVAMCSCYKMRTDETIPRFPQDSIEKVMNPTDALFSLFYRKEVTAYPVLKLWKRDILLEAEFPEDMLYGEDFVFVYKMLQKCEKIVYGSKILYIYYQNQNSINHNVNYAQLVHSWEVFTSTIFKDVKEKYPELMDAARSKNYILAIDYYNRIFKMNDECELRKRLLRYIKESGFGVSRDINCKSLNRILGILGGIWPAGLCFLCRRFNDLKAILKFEVRHSV